jgi:hypothetical protein
VKEIGHDQPEHGVAQELERLVVGNLARRTLVREARVGESLVEKQGVGEAVPEPFLEGQKLR